jgi:hypothetical protein
VLHEGFHELGKARDVDEEANGRKRSPLLALFKLLKDELRNQIVHVCFQVAAPAQVYHVSGWVGEWAGWIFCFTFTRRRKVYFLCAFA